MDLVQLMNEGLIELGLDQPVLLSVDDQQMGRLEPFVEVGRLESHGLTKMVGQTDLGRQTVLLQAVGHQGQKVRGADERDHDRETRI